MSTLHQAIARETARLRDGRFGAQVRAEAGDITLTTPTPAPTPAAPQAPVRARTWAEIRGDAARDSRMLAEAQLGRAVSAPIDPYGLRTNDEIFDDEGTYTVAGSVQRHDNGAITVPVHGPHGPTTRQYPDGQKARVRRLATTESEAR